MCPTINRIRANVKNYYAYIKAHGFDSMGFFGVRKIPLQVTLRRNTWLNQLRIHVVSVNFKRSMHVFGGCGSAKNPIKAKDRQAEHKPHA